MIQVKENTELELKHCSIIKILWIKKMETYIKMLLIVDGRIMAIYDFITNTYANYCLLVYNQKQVEH